MLIPINKLSLPCGASWKFLSAPCEATNNSLIDVQLRVRRHAVNCCPTTNWIIEVNRKAPSDGAKKRASNGIKMNIIDSHSQR